MHFIAKYSSFIVYFFNFKVIHDTVSEIMIVLHV